MLVSPTAVVASPQRRTELNGVHGRLRAGVLTLSLVRSRRPTLLDIVPPSASSVAVGRCERHGGPVLTASA